MRNSLGHQQKFRVSVMYLAMRQQANNINFYLDEKNCLEEQVALQNHACCGKEKKIQEERLH